MNGTKARVLGKVLNKKNTNIVTKLYKWTGKNMFEVIYMSFVNRARAYEIMKICCHIGKVKMKNTNIVKEWTGTCFRKLITDTHSFYLFPGLIFDINSFFILISFTIF